MQKKISKLFILTGPSGVGKGTILKEFFKNNSEVKYSISSTTRAPREGEVNGEHYFFISVEEFLKSVENNEFLEYAKYGENYYGTNKNFVLKTLEEGFSVILEIEVQGAKLVMEEYKNAVSIFIAPPTLKELERRLRGRKSEDEKSILRRLEIAKEEIKEIEKYKYNFKNDTVEHALFELQKIYESEVQK